MQNRLKFMAPLSAEAGSYVEELLINDCKVADDERCSSNKSPPGNGRDIAMDKTSEAQLTGGASSHFCQRVCPPLSRPSGDQGASSTGEGRIAGMMTQSAGSNSTTTTSDIFSITV